jgi:hypothetical protein
MSRSAERVARLREKLADLGKYIVVTIAGSDRRPPIIIDYRTAKYVDGHLVIPSQRDEAAPRREISTRAGSRRRSRSSTRQRGA